MSRAKRDARLIELVDAFTELGPAWVRWVEGTIPDDTVSYARLRILNKLDARSEGMTMSRLAEALGVTRRRVTALIDALEDDGLVERYAHPTDKRSTVVVITAAGGAQQHQVWKDHQDKVAVAFGDLSDQDQIRLLDITRQLTAAFRRHLAALAPSDQDDDFPDVMLIRNNRRVRPPRSQPPAD